MSSIETHNLVKEWGKVRAVDGVSFRVAEGSLTVLLGPSGCGKSTILRMIAGLEDVTSGKITIGGQDVTHVDAAKRGVSMVFQSYALFPHLNVRENILFGLKVRRVDPVERRKRLNEVAKMVGLEGLLHRKPSKLSGGQQQRVALARSIVSQQPVCLMDEPLSNLDAKLRNEMREEIRALQQKLGLTMIYVTHDQTEACSTTSSESAPRSSTNVASFLTSSSSTPSCSTMMCLTFSSTEAMPSSVAAGRGAARATPRPLITRSHVHSAVDVQRCPRDVARVRAGQEQDGLGNVRRPPRPLHGDAFEQRLARLLAQ